MSKMMDLSGQSFGKWKVLYLSPNKTKENKPMWVCRCECGNIKEVSAASLKAGQSKSCGECKGFATPYLVRTHSNRLYHAWSEMHRRCNGQSTNSDYYSEKGICVCPEWNDFDSFANWSITHDYEKGYEIDRIDSDKDYSPDNCRWVTHKKNSRNRKARSNNKTGVPGVQIRYRKDGSISYRVTISSDNGKINVGTFSTIQEATIARKKAEIKYWGFNIGE